MSASAFRDPSGEFYGMVLNFKDITYRKQIEEKLRELAATDGLTRIYNRRHFFELANRECERVKRYGAALSMLMVDVDNFKLVNDTYGHEAGDELIKMVAQTMLANIRPFDFIFRWGGDEFLLILVNVDQRRLHASADRIRTAVQNTGLRFGSDTIRGTVSVGGTVAEPDDMDKSILARTDGFMYRCKEEGRNKCLVDNLSMPPAAQPNARAAGADSTPHQTVSNKIIAAHDIRLPALFGRVDIHAPVSIAVFYRHSASSDFLKKSRAENAGTTQDCVNNHPVFDLIIYPAQHTPPIH